MILPRVVKPVDRGRTELTSCGRSVWDQFGAFPEQTELSG